MPSPTVKQEDAKAVYIEPKIMKRQAGNRPRRTMAEVVAASADGPIINYG
jgi:hypothetical protein